MQLINMKWLINETWNSKKIDYPGSWYNNNLKKKTLSLECMSTNQEPNAKEAEQFWSKIWEQKEYNKKT